MKTREILKLLKKDGWYEKIYYLGGNVMKNFVFPAIFTYDKVDKVYLVSFVDLEGCSTFGKTIDEAYVMAQDALGLYLSDLIEFPEPTIPFSNVKLNPNQFISLVEVDLVAHRKKHSDVAVKKTLTIPTWLNTLAEKNDINFSQTLQKALKEELNIG